MTQATLNPRPNDCECWNPSQDLACFACFRGGFEDPNPNPPEANE